MFHGCIFVSVVMVFAPVFAKSIFQMFSCDKLCLCNLQIFSVEKYLWVNKAYRFKAPVKQTNKKILHVSDDTNLRNLWFLCPSSTSSCGSDSRDCRARQSTTRRANTEIQHSHEMLEPLYMYEFKGCLHVPTITNSCQCLCSRISICPHGEH